MFGPVSAPGMLDAANQQVRRVIIRQSLSAYRSLSSAEWAMHKRQDQVPSRRQRHIRSTCGSDPQHFFDFRRRAQPTLAICSRKI